MTPPRHSATIKSAPPREAEAEALARLFEGESWLHSDEGKLAVDVSEDAEAFIVTTAIAGVEPHDLDVFVQHDMLTIRGSRPAPHDIKEGRHLIQECHWGAFSRSIILPAEIDADGVRASLKAGILTIRLPKTERKKKVRIDID